MANRYAVVARTYWTLRMAGVLLQWMLCVFLLSLGRFDKYLAIWLGVGIGVFAVGIGFHLMEQIANPRASLMPDFRPPHLAVAAAVSLPVLALTTALIWWVGGKSLPGTAAVILTIFTVVFGGMCVQPKILIGTIPLFVLATITPQGRSLCTALFEGRANLAAVLLLLCCAALLVTVWTRLMRLNEDMPAYNLPVQFTYGFRLADPRAQARLWSAWQGHGSQSNWLWDLFTRRVPARLDGRRRDDFWTRAYLWRVGMSPMKMGRFFVILVTVFVLVSAVFAAGVQAAMTQILSSPAMLAAQFGMMMALQSVERWPRLGYELLRPTRRADFFRQMSLALGLEIFEVWLWFMLSGWLILAIWAPALLRAADITVLLAFAVSCALSQWAATSLVTTYSRSYFVVLPVLALTFITWMILNQMYLSLVPNFGWTTDTYLMVAAGVAILSVGALWIADRRWQRLDLS